MVNIRLNNKNNTIKVVGGKKQSMKVVNRRENIRLKHAGTPGSPGDEILLRNNITHIQWKYSSDTEWNDLVALSDITGEDGADGREIELQATTTHIQWRYIGEAWNNLLAIEDIMIGSGRGITSIEKTSTIGLTDTYTITYSDSTTSTFDIENGYTPVEGIDYFSDKNYIKEFLLSNTVNVNHNLNKRVSVAIIDSAGSEIEAEVKQTDLNNLIVTFTSQFSGTVICN